MISHSTLVTSGIWNSLPPLLYLGLRIILTPQNLTQQDLKTTVGKLLLKGYQPRKATTLLIQDVTILTRLMSGM